MRGKLRDFLRKFSAPDVGERRIARRFGQHHHPSPSGPLVEALAKLVGDSGWRARQQVQIDRARRMIEAHQTDPLLEMRFQQHLAMAPCQRNDFGEAQRVGISGGGCFRCNRILEEIAFVVRAGVVREPLIAVAVVTLFAVRRDVRR